MGDFPTAKKSVKTFRPKARLEDFLGIWGIIGGTMSRFRLVRTVVREIQYIPRLGGGEADRTRRWTVALPWDGFPIHRQGGPLPVMEGVPPIVGPSILMDGCLPRKVHREIRRNIFSQTWEAQHGGKTGRPNVVQLWEGL